MRLTMNVLTPQEVDIEDIPKEVVDIVRSYGARIHAWANYRPDHADIQLRLVCPEGMENVASDAMDMELEASDELFADALLHGCSFYMAEDNHDRGLIQWVWEQVRLYPDVVYTTNPNI